MQHYRPVDPLPVDIHEVVERRVRPGLGGLGFHRNDLLPLQQDEIHLVEVLVIALHVELMEVQAVSRGRQRLGVVILREHALDEEGGLTAAPLLPIPELIVDLAFECPRLHGIASRYFI